MLHFSPVKIAAIALTVLVGLLFALPNFLSKETLAAWPRFLPSKQLPLGLDLRGGAHLLLEMDTSQLRRAWLNTLRDDARRQLREAKIAPAGIGITGNSVQVRTAKPEETDAALRELRKLSQQVGSAILGTSGQDVDVVKADGGVITLTPTDLGLRGRVGGAADAAIVTIERRINQLGTAESTVVRQGRDRILIQFPGLQDTTRLKALIGDTAKLSFHDVSDDDPQSGRVRPGFKVYEAKDAKEGRTAYLLRETPEVDGTDLIDAQPGFDQRTQEPIITFRFNLSGARKFGKFTTENVGRPFAIVLDDKVISAPRINEPITGGSGQISGSFTVESARDLAISLRSGALPAKLTIVEERTVGPSLGSDSIEAGRLAGIIGCTATAILTILAYGTFGIYAVIGLLVHGLLILALMTAIGTTLTLPGIAGFVLTIGMAVDANVLIYERIREELRAGKSAIAAIDAGFTRAIVTIADSQLTTLAAAIIMFWLGSGPIRGFAVTLTLGILTSVFSAVTVTRLLVALWLRQKRASTRKIDVPV